MQKRLHIMAEISVHKSILEAHKSALLNLRSVSQCCKDALTCPIFVYQDAVQVEACLAAHCMHDSIRQLS